MGFVRTGGRRGTVVAAAVTLLAGAALAPGSAPAKAKPKCFGKRATIVRGDGDNHIKGTHGKDVIVAGGGNDVVSSGKGGDRVCGGSGDDLLDDSIDVFESGGDDRFHGGAGVDEIVGWGGDDRVLGGKGDDGGTAGLYGFDGDDIVRGGAGSDHVVGDEGEDRLFGGSGDDRVSSDNDSDPDDVFGGSDYDLCTINFGFPSRDDTTGCEEIMFG
jgi:Ca2+-binding RTX toxin-like protein